jgi:hypothetical protein
MLITNRSLSRRTMLRGIGATVALPLLEAMMVPARAAWARGAAAGTQASGTFALSAGKTRLLAMEMVHGAAGSTAFGIEKNMWSPAEAGSAFDLGPTSLV